MKPYYEAYDDRYRAIHALGLQWSSDAPTAIVRDALLRFGIAKSDPIMEIGCGEGRDAHPLLNAGYDLLATDLSPEVVAFCRKRFPDYAKHFAVLDAINGVLSGTYGFIYAVAVLHMLVKDGDRLGFLRFIRGHLQTNGYALICTMGDGRVEMQSDPAKAFEIQTRSHSSGKVSVAATSCRMVSFDTLHRELNQAGLRIVEEGITSAMPDFDSLMYVVVQKVNG